MRQLYCVVALPHGIDFQYDGHQLVPVPPVPTVVGPFKTKHQAKVAGERDWGNHPGVRYAVVPLLGYSDAQDRQISLTYERMWDPTYRRKKVKEDAA